MQVVSPHPPQQTSLPSVDWRSPNAFQWPSFDFGDFSHSVPSAHLEVLKIPEWFLMLCKGTTSPLCFPRCLNVNFIAPSPLLFPFACMLDCSSSATSKNRWDRSQFSCSSVYFMSLKSVKRHCKMYSCVFSVCVWLCKSISPFSNITFSSFLATEVNSSGPIL